MLREKGLDVTWNREVWFASGIPRHKFLTWLIVLNRCPTKDKMISWGLYVDPLCVLCNSHFESRNHLLFDCQFNWIIWNYLATMTGFHSPRRWHDLLISFRQDLGTGTHKKLLRIFWQASLYLIWRERNTRIHRQVFRSTDSLLKEVYLLIKNRISSLRDLQPLMASNMMQLWLSN